MAVPCGASAVGGGILIGSGAAISVTGAVGMGGALGQVYNESSNASTGGGEVFNAAGKAYPKVPDPRTGGNIPPPGNGLKKTPVDKRAAWGKEERGAYIKQWYDKGFSTPEGGWTKYDVHHITPREYGGNNDFNNLVPVRREVHQQQFNPWWSGYGG